jgi:hypothetical protein
MGIVEEWLSIATRDVSKLRRSDFDVKLKTLTMTSRSAPRLKAVQDS